MRSALWLAPTLLLAGCGDMYYQTRYIPVSAESVYSPSEQLTWTGDKQVYELPANPPALDELHRTRIDCKPPGQAFKPIAVVGIKDSERHREVGQPALVGGINSDPEPGLPFGPGKRLPVAAWMDADPQGARDRIGLIPVAGSDTGPFPFRGSGRVDPAMPIAAYRSDQVDWCTTHPGSLTPTP
jgi:hypothetical protein